MESGSAGNVMAEDADSQWQDIGGHGTAMTAVTAQSADKRNKPRHSSRRRRVYRVISNSIPRSRQRAVAAATVDSTPLMVADFTFRKQVEWLMENTGVRHDFKDVAQKIWFSYLSQYMPDLKNGVEVELGGTSYWHLAYPRGDLIALLHCTRKEVDQKLAKLRQCSVPEEDSRNADLGMVSEATRITKKMAHLKLPSQSASLRADRPTASLLLAILVITCHICKEEVLLSDLLRWVRLLQLPLLDMTPYGSTKKVMRVMPHARGKEPFNQQGVAKYAHVEGKVAWLASRLLKDKVASLPGLPVAPLVQRFIEELNLPHDMIPFVLGLLDRINSAKYQIEYTSLTHARSYKRGKNIECLVMCCIFYALRILFVLDDSTEDDISQATERMQVLIRTVKLFNFRVWHQHLLHRRVLLFKHTMLSRQVCCATAHADFVQMNQAPLSALKGREPRMLANRSARERELHLVDSLGQLDINNSSPSSLLLHLPPTVRPYRAHTEALSGHYPELAVAFSRHTIKHLLDDQSWTEHLKPAETAVNVRTELAAVRRLRKAGYDQMVLIRLFKNRDNQMKKLVEEDNLPRIVRDLVRTLADMIDHEFAFFFGTLVFLDLAFFPNNSLCRHIGHSRGLKHMRTV